MERGRWNGNNWGLIGPNGQLIEVKTPRRQGNGNPPGRVVTGFQPRPGRNSHSPKTARRRSGGLSSINLREGPRNIYTLLANKNLPNVVKEGLREVLYKRLVNEGTTSEIARALANINFKNSHRAKLTEAMYETMNTRNLFKLQGNPVVNAIIKKRALNGAL